MANKEENKAIVTRYVDATNRGDFDVFNELVVPDYVEHNPVPGQKPGREGLVEAYKMFNSPFPDLAFIFEDVLGEDDLVFGRGVISGTHQGTFFGVPPTGKKVYWTGTRMFRLRDGKVIEGWVNINMLALMQQMGIVPSPPGYDPALKAPPAPNVATTPEDTPERNKAIMRRMIDGLWNQGDLSVADELFHPESVSPTAPTIPPGPEGVKMIVRMFRGAFPDYWIRIENIVADGDRVAARFTQGGTHKGDLMGIAPTGKTVEWTEMGILRIANGQVVESWYDVDMLGLMGQIMPQQQQQ